MKLACEFQVRFADFEEHFNIPYADILKMPINIS
jgi:hypothetical protein